MSATLSASSSLKSINSFAMIFSTAFAGMGGRAGDSISILAFCAGVAKLLAPLRREGTEKRGVVGGWMPL